jgi:hypothetical protein
VNGAAGQGAESRGGRGAEQRSVGYVKKKLCLISSFGRGRDKDGW